MSTSGSSTSKIVSPLFEGIIDSLCNSFERLVEHYDISHITFENTMILSQRYYGITVPMDSLDTMILSQRFSFERLVEH